jgi:hypothetical protein
MTNSLKNLQIQNIMQIFPLKSWFTNQLIFKNMYD